MTNTEIMATTRAAWELSGYSNNSQILRWRSFEGRGFSSSFMNPSSSLKMIVDCFIPLRLKKFEIQPNFYCKHVFVVGKQLL